MDSTLRANRVSRLKKRFQDVLSGSVELQDSRGASLFLEGLCAQDDPVACLDAIVDSANGLSSVQSAMRFDLSANFMNGLGSTVLQYLLKGSEVGGGALDNVLFHVVEPPIFWGVFVRAFQQEALSEDAQLAFAQLLSRLLTLQDQDTSPYQEVASRPSIQNCLAKSSKHEIREIGHLITHILSSSSPLTIYDALNGPGGRHNNDFADYHDIAILPTADEIMCRKPPFLRTALHDELVNSETPVKDYLDNTFRMLREDMIYDIREEVKGALQENTNHRSFRVDVSLVGIYTGVDKRKTPWGVKLQCDTDFSQLRGVKDHADRIGLLTRDPGTSKILRHQSLACLASGQDIISFGTVNRVEELLASRPPVIVFQLDSDVNVKKTLTSLRAGRTVQLIQIASAVFAFEPVLSALKRCSVRLHDDIILWSPGSPVEASKNSVVLSHLANMITTNPSVDIGSLLDLPKPIRLDKAQARSLVAGLQQRISLIQGPPGTGKSFIGAILAKAIHDGTGQTILVICYTNHALDQFLGDLLKYGIPDNSIVRLGGRSNQSTEHLSLHRQPRYKFSYDWETINCMNGMMFEAEYDLETGLKSVLCTNTMTYLERNHREFYDAFYVSSLTEDDMTRVGRDGRAIDKDYLFSRWRRGLDAGVLSGELRIRASARIWGMDRSSRQRLLDKWQEELVASAAESMCRAGKKYNTYQDAVRQEFAQSTVGTLKGKRIIACTTMGAAIYAKSLEKVGPEVLLVEEAGEILESHVLTALSSRVNQMILIGDHKQLRPKVNNYQLTVERGEGFDLNRSLFERLVLKGYPHETLSTQHRMRPEISAFVRELTYPELVDAPSTHQRPDVRGLQSNIVFVDHSHPEDDDRLIGDRADGGNKSSKQNSYEVQMVLRIVRYLAQQGYKSEDMVVLTPYLGQLHQLRNALRDDNDLILNEMDSLDLVRAGLSLALAPGLKAKKNKIHLATIDNYQGEESDIVIASLTRSNKSNAIGFMDSPERLNVLLSRARNGLILIGNSQTFLRSRKGGALWKRFFDLLEKGGYVYEGFPVKCERHPGRKALLKCANDFDDHCPDGGCTEPCGFTPACGHTCPMKCHARPRTMTTTATMVMPVLNDPHDTSRCKHETREMCQAGRHRITWECRFGKPSACSACNKETEKQREEARITAAALAKEYEEERERASRLAAAEWRERMIAEEEKRRKEKLRLDALERMERQRTEELEAERRRREEEIIARREKLIAERRREDARVAAVARAREYDVERGKENAAKEERRREENERLRLERRQHEEELTAVRTRELFTAERQREEVRVAAVARRVEEEKERAAQLATAERRDRLIAEIERRRQGARASVAIARTNEERKGPTAVQLSTAEKQERLITETKRQWQATVAPKPAPEHETQKDEDGFRCTIQ